MRAGPLSTTQHGAGASTFVNIALVAAGVILVTGAMGVAVRARRSRVAKLTEQHAQVMLDWDCEGM